ncbi:MAG: hypothetical protein IPK01_10775 [Acidobacteria bacterium]|nr:hypothetical protein [Acidobacteriota bacterium]
MRFQSILTILVCLFATSFVLAQANSEFPDGLRGFSMSSSFQFDGKEYRYELNTDAIKDTPSWNVSDGEPPLPIVRAVDIAKAQLKKLIKKTKGWDVDFVNLHQADRKKWYYEIHFTCIEIGCSDKATGGFTILVKLDGSPVEPKVTKVPNRS